MAAVHWLTETGEMEPASVCPVDYSDEGGAVEFAHQLYRSVHGFACRRQGFVIADDGGDALYTWRWTGDAPLDTLPAEDTETRPALTAEISKPVHPHVEALRGLGERVHAPFGSIRPKVARLAVAASVRHLPRSRQRATQLSKGLVAKLAVFLRQAQSVWRTLTQWERAAGPISDAPHRAR